MCAWTLSFCPCVLVMQMLSFRKAVFCHLFTRWSVSVRLSYPLFVASFHRVLVFAHGFSYPEAEANEGGKEPAHRGRRWQRQNQVHQAKDRKGSRKRQRQAKGQIRGRRREAERQKWNLELKNQNKRRKREGATCWRISSIRVARIIEAQFFPPHIQSINRCWSACIIDWFILDPPLPRSHTEVFFVFRFTLDLRKDTIHHPLVTEYHRFPSSFPLIRLTLLLFPLLLVSWYQFDDLLPCLLLLLEILCPPMAWFSSSI